MEKLKKALRWSCSNNEEDCRVGGKCDGSSGGVSEGEEGDIFREPLNTNGHSSRKRVKLQGKASEDYNPVDLAVVPRKLRSAINKRLSQSASPPLSDSKRRHLHTLNGTQSSNGRIAERFGQNMLDQVTKDEEEVAEALTALASSITISTPMTNKDKRRNLEENSETKATSTSPSEGLHELVLEAEPSALEQPITASISQNIDAGGNETTPSHSDLTLLSNNRKESDLTCLRGSMNSSNPLGTSLQYLAGNGGLQQAQLDASYMHKRDIGLWHLGSASIEKDLPSVKQNLVSGISHYVSKKETTGGWLGFPSTDHAQFTISSSSKTTGCQRSVTASTRSSSTRNDLPTEMLPPPTTDKKTPCKRCATHVYISHLVRNYQNAEKKQRSSLPNNQSKDKEGRSSFLPTSIMTIGLRNGMIPPLSNGCHMESSLEGSSQIVQDGRLVQARMVSTLSGAYAQQKHGGDHFSISAAGDAKNSGNGLQPSGQLPVHFLQHHSLMSLPFVGGPYSSHYQDQLTAAATQQVQLQRPHYMNTGPLYGSQMVQVTGGTATKQQQQMWQAQLAHYGPPLGFQVQWQQNGQHPDSFQPSSSLHSQGPSSIFPLPKDFHPPNGQQHFLLPRPSSSSLPSRPKQQQQQQHNGGGFNLESSSQLQMLCNTETFR